MAIKNLNEPALIPDVTIPDPGPDKILGPGHDYATVTERISGVVYLPWKQSPEEMARRRVHLLLLCQYSRHSRLLSIPARASASGVSISLLPGVLPSSTSFGGSVSAMPAR